MDQEFKAQIKEIESLPVEERIEAFKELLNKTKDPKLKEILNQQIEEIQLEIELQQWSKNQKIEEIKTPETLEDSLKEVQTEKQLQEQEEMYQKEKIITKDLYNPITLVENKEEDKNLYSRNESETSYTQQNKESSSYEGPVAFKSKEELEEKKKRGVY